MEPVPAAAPAANPAASVAPSALALPVPANLIDFVALYGTDAACRAALARARWPGGFACPRCSHGRGYRLAERIEIECVCCGHQASATAGTLLHGTKLELHKHRSQRGALLTFVRCPISAALSAGRRERRAQQQAASAPGGRELQDHPPVEAQVRRPAALPRLAEWELATFEYPFNQRGEGKRPLLLTRLMESGLKAAAKTRANFPKNGTLFRQLGLS